MWLRSAISFFTLEDGNGRDGSTGIVPAAGDGNGNGSAARLSRKQPAAVRADDKDFEQF